jgi:hypothetical protein
MKKQTVHIIILLFLAGVQPSRSQGGISDPLGFIGADNLSIAGTRARAMGWSSIGNANDATALFNNPALLSRLQDYEVRIGGISTSTTSSQRQEWYPDKVYATLSLLLEDRLVGISDTGQNQIVLERKYDDIGPNWSKERSRIRPSGIVGAVPLEVSGMRMTMAVGYSEMVNLDHYFQNNNAMDPYVGSHRPQPYPRPVLGDTTKVRWYQFIRQREGSIYGIVPAVSMTLFDDLSIGLSASILDGTSDDSQQRRERGFFRFATSSSGNFNVYFVDSVYYRQSLKGTSSYSGVQTTIGIGYEGGNYFLGLVLKPGYTITRKFSGTLMIDTAGSVTTQSVTLNEKLTLPFTYAFGGSFAISNRLRLAVDYLVNNYAETKMTTADGISMPPWLDGEMYRIGLEFYVMDELAVRCGFRENTQVFSGEGAPIVDDPVRGYGLTAGLGYSLGVVSMNVAYEYSRVKFEDKWISNINYNDRSGHTIVAEAGIRF